MSSFMGQAGNGTAGNDTTLAADDIRLMPEWMDHDYRDMESDEWFTLIGFANGWWPGTGGMDASGDEWCKPVWFDRPEIVSGASGFFGITGVTRDVYGSVIGGATVRLFRTSDGALVSTVTSDPVSGAFTAPTPYYPDAHFVVASKTGSPDVTGTSIQTLVAG